MSMGFNSPYNLPEGFTPGAQSFTKVLVDEKGRKVYDIPEFARFKLLISYANGKSNKGYSQYFSIDYDKKTGDYNEKEGLQGLINIIDEVHPCDLRLASIFGNFTYDVSTKSHKYNYKVMIVKSNGEKKFQNFWKEPVFREFADARKRNLYKVDIAKTIGQYA